MNIQLTVVVALHPLRKRYRKKFWHKIPKTREKFSFSSVLSYIFISYEYSKNRTRMLGKSVHGNFVAKREKKHQISVFHFQKYAWIYIWCLFPQLHSWCSQHSHWSQWASAPLRKGRVRDIQHCTSSLVTECLECCVCSLTSFPPDSSKPDHPECLLGIQPLTITLHNWPCLPSCCSPTWCVTEP